MKTRTDFVTNSSSSSFVIARKKDYTKKDLYDHLYCKEKFKIESFLKDYYENYGEDDGYVEHNIKIDKFISDLSDRLYNSVGLELGEYIVDATEFSNENDIVDCYVYENNVMNDEDNFKIR